MPDNMRENRNMKLHASGEDYLETILVLQKKLGIVRSVDVARHMGVSKPSVCVAVNTLKDGGFLTMDEDHFLHLTDVLYNCSASRPSIESETKEDTIEPGTETLSLTADPRSDGLVKARTGDTTDQTTYDNWYKTVYTPVETEEEQS